LVYFVASRGDSVVKKGLKGSYTLGDTGTTVIGGQIVGSEVYLSGQQDNPVGLGKLAFHELMHNVCLMQNELHAVKGLSLGLGRSGRWHSAQRRRHQAARQAPEKETRPMEGRLQVQAEKVSTRGPGGRLVLVGRALFVPWKCLGAL
jgi:hypothetical protein